MKRRISNIEVRAAAFISFYFCCFEHTLRVR